MKASAEWPHDAVRISGPDAQTYLQSQLSQDIRELAIGEAAWTLLLQPTGKIDVLAQIERTEEDAYVMRVDTGFGDALISRLNRFKIRVKADVARLDGVAGDPARYEAERISAGWPAMGAEITERSIPGELPDVVRVAVSFTKGCYPGQELVERMDSRAAEAPRHLVRLTVAEGAAPGDPIVIDGAHVGELTSVSGRAALGFVKRGVTVPD